MKGRFIPWLFYEGLVVDVYRWCSLVYSLVVHTQTIRYKKFSAGRIAKRLFLQEMIKMILCEEVVKVAIFL